MLDGVLSGQGGGGAVDQLELLLQPPVLGLQERAPGAASHQS
jgi:hypothetical protein